MKKKKKEKKKRRDGSGIYGLSSSDLWSLKMVRENTFQILGFLLSIFYSTYIVFPIYLYRKTKIIIVLINDTRYLIRQIKDFYYLNVSSPPHNFNKNLAYGVWNWCKKLRFPWKSLQLIKIQLNLSNSLMDLIHKKISKYFSKKDYQNNSHQ